MKPSPSPSSSHLRMVPGYNGRRFETCNYVDDGGTIIIHERTYRLRLPPLINSPAAFLAASRPSQTKYWLINICYSSKTEVERDAAAHGFHAMLDPYCEAGRETWFPVFADMTCALRYLYAKWGKCYAILDS